MFTKTFDPSFVMLKIMITCTLTDRVPSHGNTDTFMRLYFEFIPTSAKLLKKNCILLSRLDSGVKRNSTIYHPHFQGLLFS